MTIVSNDAAILQRKIHSQQGLPCHRRGPEDYFPEPMEGKASRALEELRAKGLCAGCPVKIECRTMSILNDDKHGIFGGMTPRARQVWAAHHGLRAGEAAEAGVAA